MEARYAPHLPAPLVAEAAASDRPRAQGDQPMIRTPTIWRSVIGIYRNLRTSHYGRRSALRQALKIVLRDEEWV